ncbi:hypothetical protein SORBI_3004G089901 [Sorghum bicolor]|uniref:Uncharacterized protein n=1 Tax=Sorghum bicolor TaxID=4558 RepID=A0A1Z5RLM2_SORBI|nr:hypothetical protein SORBI_3004G089901 [Sorghum bicolor]
MVPSHVEMISSVNLLTTAQAPPIFRYNKHQLDGSLVIAVLQFRDFVGMDNTKVTPIVLLALLILGCLALAHCEADGARSGGHLQLDDEANSSKVYVIYGTCYCCESLNGEPCYNTREDCRRVCPVCSPHCKPPASSRSLRINSRLPVAYKKLSTGS